MSGTVGVLTYRGHRSGRKFCIPLRYAEASNGRIVTLAVQPERKLWWRSFVEPTPATILIRGSDHAVTGRLLQGDERRVALRVYVSRFPRAKRPVGLPNGESDGALDGAAAAVVAFDSPG